MKAYLIDTPNKQITEVEYNGDWKTIKEHIRADCFTVVYIDASRFPDCVFVDDEGLINDNPHGWFKINTYEQPLRGYGLVLGTDADGDSVAPTIDIETLRSRITFHDDDELADPESFAKIEVQGFDDPEAFLKALFGSGSALDEFHADHERIVEALYSHDKAPDFDAFPALMISVDGAKITNVISGDVNPLDAAAAIIRRAGAVDMASFMSPVWRKDPEGNRIGEGVVLVSETVSERRVTAYNVERNPLRLQKHEGDVTDIHSRVTLLYQPNPRTEH